MIPKHTVSVVLDPNITCVLENRIDQGIVAIFKVKKRHDVVLQPQVWAAILRKKELLEAINHCITQEREETHTKIF